jgi:hypothetical protein
VREAFESEEYGKAAGLLEEQLERQPKDPFVTYNLACARAMAGDRDAAGEALIDAVGFGFSDLFHAARDPHLAPIRGEKAYTALMKGWRRVLDARGEADLTGAREMLGPGYVYERDERLRLTFASAMGGEAFDSAKREVRRVAAWAEGALSIGMSEDEARPDPWVLVILPTPEDFVTFIGKEGIGGHYDKDRKRLIARDIGPTLRHEFFHVVHWRQMDRLGQRHPYWVMEGLASLLEDVVDEGEGYALAPSWRTNIAKRLEKSGRLTGWERLFAMERGAFMGSTARANYAQARSVLMFLQAKGALRGWYEEYTRTWVEDGSGLRAIERALGVTAREAERRHSAWLRELPMAGEIGKPGQAGLGVELKAGSGDGPEVAGIVAMSRAKHAGEERLRMRDVITAVNGRSTRCLDELHRVMAEFEVGEVVTLTVRRGSRMVEVEMELVDGEVK